MPTSNLKIKSIQYQQHNHSKQQNNHTNGDIKTQIQSDLNIFPHMLVACKRRNKTIGILGHPLYKRLRVFYNRLGRCRVIDVGGVGEWKTKNVLVNGCNDVGFQKTQWTNTSRWHCTPNHHRLWKLNPGLHAIWAMSFSTLPPDSRTLVSK